LIAIGSFFMRVSTIALAGAALALTAAPPLFAQTPAPAAPAVAATATSAVAFELPETTPQDPAARPLTLSAPDIHADKPMPQTYAASGKDISPKLYWSPGPAGTKSYVLLEEDPDGGGTTPIVHWLAYNIPPMIHALTHSMRNIGDPTSPLGMLQGWNDHGSVGYSGPRPPAGAPAEHYVFQIYALDTVLRLKKDAYRDQVLKAMRGHVLAKGEFITTYAEAAPKPKTPPQPAAPTPSPHRS
jgi:Raf kinase inhibitor-like YbhB/YbcL family protein